MSERCPICKSTMDHNRIKGWFTGKMICSQCGLEEMLVRKDLKKRGIPVSTLKNCGYVPNADGHNPDSFKQISR